MTAAPKPEVAETVPKDAEVAETQAISQGIVPAAELEYEGEKYKLADEIGHLPLMKFAHYVEAGVDERDLGALSSLYEALHDCLSEEDWTRFERALMQHKAKVDDMLELIGKAMELITARPTESP